MLAKIYVHNYFSFFSMKTYVVDTYWNFLIRVIVAVGTYNIHYNLFITRFIITRFWIKHGSKMDPKNV